MSSIPSPYQRAAGAMCQLKFKRELTTKIQLYQIYLSSYQALEHCHQLHQKNLASPSCALWRRSQLESERERSVNKGNTS